MTTQLAKTGQRDIVRDGAFDLTPHSLNEAMQLADMMAKSELVPQQFRNRPADVMIAVQYGAELGLPPLQALSGICVINGRACVWGDCALAVVLKSGLMENYKEMTGEQIQSSGKAVFWCKRKGVAEPIVREFSIEDAKKAKLWNNPSKKPIWVDYPWRMLQMRARSWALRDGFADALKGMAIREEVEDYVQTEAPPALAMPRRLSEKPHADGEASAIPAPELESTPNVPEDQELFSNDTPAQDPGHDERLISDPQRKRLYAIARGAGCSDNVFKEELQRMGIDSSANIRKDQYTDICSYFENMKK